MAIIVIRCPQCNRIAEEKSSVKLGVDTLVTYKCGHSVIQSSLQSSKKYTSFDGDKTLFPFQQSDLASIELTNARALLTYECGLGKTITSLFTTYNHPELLPTLVICKSKLISQWMRQILSITGETPIILSTGGQAPIPGIKYHIISFDLIPKYNKKEQFISAFSADVIDGKECSNSLGDHGFKTIIIDEVQNIQNLTAARTQAIMEICKFSEHVIGLSASPFRNNAGEYFPILNILQPTKFPIKEQFYRDWCEIIYSGRAKKIGGLRSPERFKEYTKDFIIHHTRDEVLPDLPKERRNFEYCDIEDKELREAYDKGIQELDEFMAENANKKKDLSYYSNLLEMLVKLRHITGLAKVDTVVDKAAEFILSTDRKMVIYHHHIDVGDLIEVKLNELLKDGGYNWKCLRLKGGQSSQSSDQQIYDFVHGSSRIFIISTLAGGEGLDGLQDICSDVIQVERQWNSVNEEQPERRFSRPPRWIKNKNEVNHISIDYIIAISTIDDYLTELIERKRKWIKEGVTGIKVDMSENVVLTELAEALVRVGKPRWRIR